LCTVRTGQELNFPARDYLKQPFVTTRPSFFSLSFLRAIIPFWHASGLSCMFENNQMFLSLFLCVS
jgi:hypothetical protein